jgi:hypothetical protein
MAKICREVQDWVEQQVEQPIEKWVEQREQQCREYDWWDPLMNGDSSPAKQRGSKLKAGQVTLLRNSRHVTFI